MDGDTQPLGHMPAQDCTGANGGERCNMFGDEELPRKAKPHEIGEDLAMISVEELHARIAILKDEITRIEAEITRKGVSRAAADDVFKR